jgi:hypothetical protein
MAIPGSTYAFPAGAVLLPGQSIQVDVQGSPSQDTHSELHWGLRGLWLPDPGGVVRVSTFTDVTLACDAWGSGRC